MAGTHVCSQAVFHLPGNKKRKKKIIYTCFKQQLGSTSPCLAPFKSHFPLRALLYFPAMPRLPRLTGQAAARLQRAARGTKGNRNSAFQLPAFESCSAETPQGAPVPRRDRCSWTTLCSTSVCFSHLVSLSSEEWGRCGKSEVLHGQLRDAVSQHIPN